MNTGETSSGSTKFPPMTSWLDVLRAAFPLNGVLLVGAGAGDGPWVRWLQSRDAASHGASVHLIEGDEQQYRHLQCSLSARAGLALRREVVAARSGTATFHRANNPAESGLLEPETLQQLWPHLGTEQSIVIEDAVTLDALQRAADRKINWLILDCLPAAVLLQGGTRLLAQLDVALVRVAKDLPARSAADQQAVDELLRAAGLRCIHIQAERHPALAHALYVRDAAEAQVQARRMGEQLTVAQSAWANEKAALQRANVAADQTANDAEQAKALAQEHAHKLGEQLKVAQEAWAKERVELTRAKQAAEQSVQVAEDAKALAQKNAQRMSEQLKAAQDAWIKEKADLTRAKETAGQKALAAEQASTLAKEHVHKLSEQLTAARETWAREQAELTRAKEIAGRGAQAAEQAKALAQARADSLSEQLNAAQAAQEQVRRLTEQLDAAQEDSGKERISLIAARDQSRREAGQLRMQIRVLERKIRDMQARDSETQTRTQSAQAELAKAEGQLEVLKQLLLPSQHHA